MATSYSDLHESGDAHREPEAILAGDFVCTGSNQYPLWRVIAVDGEKAWLRNTQTHADGVTDVRRCRKVDA